jgi:hypothetical protein
MSADEGIEQLVDRLNSLKDGEHVAAELMACGKKAIRSLRRFLLDGKPSHIFQPRQHAVEALAGLGAKEVLIEYLARDKEVPDPVDRYGEEAVENTAARLLARWRDEDVYNVLLPLLRRKPMPGVVETIGEFGRTEAIPYFIRALEDDIARGPAEEALWKVGEPARPALLDAALTPEPTVAEESPSSMRRRRSAMRLLAMLPLAAEDWSRLAVLTTDRDPEISARAARVALLAADDRWKHRAVRRLAELLPKADSFLQAEIESWLLRYSAIAENAIDEEIALRRLAASESGSGDTALRLLLGVKNRIGRKR